MEDMEEQEDEPDQEMKDAMEQVGECC